MKVYICTVGSNLQIIERALTKEELYTKDEIKKEIIDPISFGFYKEYKDTKKLPDKAYLLYTEGERGSKPNFEKLKNKWGKLIELSGVVVDGFDLENISYHTRDIFENEKNADIVANITSGTNPMFIGAFLESLEYSLQSNQDIKMMYIKEFRDNRTAERGIFDTMEIQYIDPQKVVSLRMFYQGMDALEKYNFEVAKSFFEHARSIKDPKFRAKARGYLHLTKAYSLWDDFEHLKALDELKSAKYEFEGLYYEDSDAKWMVNNLSKKINFIESKLKPDMEDKNNPIYPHIFHIFDCFENAYRMFARGKVLDGTVRLYRSIEMLLEWRLAEKYNLYLEKRNFDIFSEDQKDKICGVYIDMMKKTGFELSKEDALQRLTKQKLYSKEIEAILSGLDDTIYSALCDFMKKRQDYIDLLRQVRNHLYLMHGLSISKEYASDKIKSAFNSYFSFLQDFFKDNYAELRDLTILYMQKEELQEHDKKIRVLKI